MVNNTVSYHFLILIWGLRYFWKRGNIRKGCTEIEDWDTSVYFVLRFQENSMQSMSAFYLFFGYKRISKCFIFFQFLIIEFRWFVYGSNSRKRYTLRLFSKCLVRSTLLSIGVKSPQPFNSLFDSLRWVPFSLALHLCSS